VQRSGDQYGRRKLVKTQSQSPFSDSSMGLRDSHKCRHVRQGNGNTIYSIGYERRTLAEVIAVLQDLNVELLVDVRERPFSRRVDFRRSSIEAACSTAGIRYENWTDLGSTEAQRKRLIATRDYGEFRRRFRSFARRYRKTALDRLSEVAKNRSVALFCYERLHEECHRGVVADLVGARVDACVIAIS